jgi:hypothetical protein
MSIATDLADILRADAELTVLLPGGIFTDPLNPSDPVTKVAWMANPTTGVKRIRPSAVLLEPQEVDSPTNWHSERSFATDLWPELVLYAERSDMPAVFTAADERVMELLHGLPLFTYRTPSGTYGVGVYGNATYSAVEPYATGNADIAATGFRARPMEADELPGDVWTTYRRYRIQMVRHIAGV